MSESECIVKPRSNRLSELTYIMALIIVLCIIFKSIYNRIFLETIIGIFQTIAVSCSCKSNA